MTKPNEPPRIVTEKDGAAVRYTLWVGNQRLYVFSSPQAAFNWWWELGSPLRWALPSQDDEVRARQPAETTPP